MDDAVHSVDGALHRRGVAHIPQLELHVQSGQGSGVGRAACEHAHSISPLEQRPYDVVADQSGRTGYEVQHGWPGGFAGPAVSD